MVNDYFEFYGEILTVSMKLVAPISKFFSTETRVLWSEQLGGCRFDLGWHVFTQMKWWQVEGFNQLPL